ncbi:hypothetical protein KAS06_03760 [Candidatus Bathyarchaeota archaeon]|nr:hypothetical protein [Candidatus Bathyarchaeota archaeon]
MPAFNKDNLDIAALIAHALYHSKSLKFGSFRIKSGIHSPYYIDLTWLLSSPQDFCCVRDTVASTIKDVMVFAQIDRLASIELKGALLLPSIACKLNMPCVVVRKARKKYGLTGRIAGGTVVEGEKILLFDDVISDGMSKIEGIKPLEEMGAKVEQVMVVVDREQGGRDNIERAGYKFHALTKTSELVNHLLESDHISEKQAGAVRDFIAECKSIKS